MGYGILNPKFPLGQVVATPAVISLGIDLFPYLRRHHCGDWGDALGEEDREANDAALTDGSRILSCYQVGGGRRIYIITEWDRSLTTVLLPEEY
jgi:hypothetical protein